MNSGLPPSLLLPNFNPVGNLPSVPGGVSAAFGCLPF